MDPITAFQVAAAAAQFGQMAVELSSRIYKFSKDISELPPSLKDLRQRLELLKTCADDLNTKLNQTPSHFSQGSLDATRLVIEGLQEKIRQMEEVVCHYLPDQSDNSVTRLTKALSSLAKDRKLIAITDSLIQDVSVLTLRQVVDPVSSESDHPFAMKTINTAPQFQVAGFVPRPRIMNQIITALEGDRNNGPRCPLVLRGMGGQGKTQLAMHYCSTSFPLKYKAIFWVNADSETSAKKDLLAISPAGKNESSKESDIHIQQIKQLLTSCPVPWLIVFDNYDNPNAYQIRDLIPPLGSNGDCLITSRHPDSQRLGLFVDVGGMEQSESLDLFFTRSGIERSPHSESHARRIANRLGNLALAVDQAGSYLGQRQDLLSIEDFLEVYESKTDEILHWIPESWEYVGPDKTARSAFTTWNLSLELLLDQDALGQLKLKILSILSIFDPNDISEALFKPFFDKMWNGGNQNQLLWLSLFASPQHTWSTERFGDLMMEFRRYSLISNLKKNDHQTIHISIHPLVRDWILNHHLTKIEADEWEILSDILGQFLAANELQLPHGYTLGFKLSEPDVYACTDHALEWYSFFIEHENTSSDIIRPLVGYEHSRSSALLVALLLSWNSTSRSRHILACLMEHPRKSSLTLCHDQHRLSCLAGCLLVMDLSQDGSVPEIQAESLARRNIAYWSSSTEDQAILIDSKIALAQILIWKGYGELEREVESICKDLLQRTDDIELQQKCKHIMCRARLYAGFEMNICLDLALEVYQNSNRSGGSEFRCATWSWDMWEDIISIFTFAPQYHSLAFGLTQEVIRFITRTFHNSPMYGTWFSAKQLDIADDIWGNWAEIEPELVRLVQLGGHEKSYTLITLGARRFMHRSYHSSLQSFKEGLRDALKYTTVTSNDHVFGYLSWLIELDDRIGGSSDKSAEYSQACLRLAQNLPDSDEKKKDWIRRSLIELALARAMKPGASQQEVRAAIHQIDVALHAMIEQRQLANSAIDIDVQTRAQPDPATQGRDIFCLIMANENPDLMKEIVILEHPFEWRRLLPRLLRLLLRVDYLEAIELFPLDALIVSAYES
ncbi:hypothetical protein F5Y16DRAFT_61845 [Xylariaceae sp. FL0255]|nr:hypothetical protein F5Y16DRAFT_61845 [Xylariaceae sp. FL0255]